MKKFNIEIEEINKYNLQISAINEKEAEKAVIDIIENTEILNMDLLDKQIKYKYTIKLDDKNNATKIYII